jgi:hypothetical protein
MVEAVPISSTSGGGGSDAPVSGGGRSGGISAQTVALIQATVGQMKAELKNELGADLQNALRPIHDDLSELKKLPGTRTLVSTIIGTGVSLFLGVFVVLGFASDRFDGGMSTTGVLAQQSVDQAKIVAEINDKLSELSKKVSADDHAQGSPREGQTGQVPQGTQGRPGGQP